MGVQTVVNQRNASPEQRANAEAYRALIARTGRFLTFAAGAATIGYRLREDPAERAALKIVKETDKGLVISGKIGMHTSPAYADDVYIGAHNGVDYKGHRATFVVAGQRARRHRGLPQARGARWQPVLRPAQHAASTSSTARCGSTTC